MPSYEYSQTSVKDLLSQQMYDSDKLEVDHTVVCGLPYLRSASLGATRTWISF